VLKVVGNEHGTLREEHDAIVENEFENHRWKTTDNLLICGTGPPDGFPELAMFENTGAKCRTEQNRWHVRSAGTA
jgi:hypothetical protein